MQSLKFGSSIFRENPFDVFPRLFLLFSSKVAAPAITLCTFQTRRPFKTRVQYSHEELHPLDGLHSFIANAFVQPLSFFAYVRIPFLRFSRIRPSRRSFLPLPPAPTSVSLSILFIYPAILLRHRFLPSRDLVASTIIKLIPIKRTDDR